MKITRLRVVNFRRFADEELDLAPGMNLIRGPNESGKSTIVRAMMAALFGKPASSSVSTQMDARWGVEDLPWIELEFTDDGGDYRLVKDYGAKKVLLVQPGEEKDLASAKAVDARITELLGFRDPGQYLRTACVTHDQMINLGEDGGSAKKLAAMLREVVIGSQESGTMDRAVKQLSSEIDELKRGLERPTNNPGTIRRLQDEREMHMTRQKDLSVGATDMEEQRDRLSEVERMIEEKSVRLADLKGITEKNMQLAEAERRYDEAQDRFEAADRIQDAAKQLESLDRRIDDSFPGFNDLDPGADAELRKAIEVRESLKSLREEIVTGADEEPREETQVLQPAPVPTRPPRRRGMLCIAAGIVLTLLGIVLGAAVHPALFAVVAPGVALIGLGSYFAARDRTSTHEAAPEQKEETEEKADEGLEEPLSRAEAQMERLEKREREFLASIGCKDADTFFKQYAEFSKLMAERGEQVAGLKALMGGRTLEQVEADRRKASMTVSSCDERLAELAAFKLPPDKLEAAVREQKSLEAELNELVTERDGLSFHLVKTASDPEDALKIEEVVSWLWEAEQSARRRLRVATLARDAMRLAAEQMLSYAVPVLAESVGHTFSRLTDGRYNKVEVRESDLAISVYSPEKGTTIPADELLSTLSKGTASQLYLSARLELVGLLSGGRKPPLIFDDSFSYFDGRRLAALWGVLEEVARDQQVLVFTCTDRYDDLAEGVNVIDLSR